jgi:hypothetical protein
MQETVHRNYEILSKSMDPNGHRLVKVSPHQQGPIKNVSHVLYWALLLVVCTTQNIGFLLSLSYIYLGYFVCLCVIECVCVSQLRNALLFF